MSQDLNSLYDQLREADKLAQAGDAQAQADAQAIYSEIQRLESVSTPVETSGKEEMPFGIKYAPEAGALLGTIGGAAAGPTFAKNVIEPVVQTGVKKLPGQGVRNYIANTTELPYAGGKTYETAYQKANIAAGQPVKSRGSQTPIRRGSLGITTQPEPPSFLRSTGNKLTSQTSAPAGRAGSALRLGAAGSLGGKFAQDINQGNYGDAALHGTGALAALAGQSRYRPLRILGNIVAGGEVASGVAPFFTPKKPVEEKAAGGLAGYNKGKRVGEVVEGGLEAAKKFTSAANKPKQLARLTAENAPKNKFSGTQKFSDAIEPYINTHSLHPTIVDRTILDLNKKRMAGPEAPYLQVISEPHRESGWSFANDSLPAASKLYNIGKDGDTLITGLLGSPTQLKTNRSVFGELADEYFKAIREGKMTPELQAKIQAKLPTLTHGKDKIQTFPDKFDIRDRDAFNEMAKGFHQRGHLADIMGGKGVSQGVPGGGKIIDYENILTRNTEPSLLDAPTHSIGSRLFTVGAKPPEYRPDLHNAFDYANFGELKSANFGYVPKEIAIPDELARIKANLVARGFDRDVTAMDIMRNSIKQPITEQLWRRAQSEGFAEGGPIKGYNAGNVVKGGLGFLKPAAKSHSQDPKVARALEAYLKGDISQAERIAIMNKELPLRPWTQMPPAYSDEQIKMALMENKRPKALAEVPVGARVGNRLDIPAYTQHGVYVDTTHDLAKGNSPISYNRTGHLKDVEFSSKPNQAVRVGLGTKEQALTPMGAEIGSAKSPFALIKGTNVGTSDEEVRRMMAEMMKDPNYAQIGMDPRRHSQFYDKSTGMPVWAAEEKLQSGPLILVPKRGLETTTWDDPRLNLSDFPGKQYAKGGSTTPAWQRKEGKNPEGGLNAAGRASYNRETGGNLKAPQPEGGPRKKSFCARMEGMKRKNTSSATANDPDSRINKSLRKWKC